MSLFRQTSLSEVTNHVMRMRNFGRKNGSRSQSLSISLPNDAEEDVETEMANPIRCRRTSVLLAMVDPQLERPVFKKRTCRIFAPKKVRRPGRGGGDDDDSESMNAHCWCGRTFEEHFPERISFLAPTAPETMKKIENIEQWETYYAKCSDAVDDTDAYGSIEFTVDSHAEHDYWFTEEKAQYIRLDKDTSAKTLFDQVNSEFKRTFHLVCKL